jgi:hypothetical protein
MPYLGNLSSASSYTLEVQTTSKVAVTVVNIRRDRISEVEILTFDPTTGVQSRSVSNNVGRLVFLAGTSVGNSAVIKIAQGTDKFEVTITPDGDLQFDVV